MPANVADTQIIKRPIVTEKATYGMNEQKKYAFLVDPRATKPEIKAAVESIYKVRVERVNTTVRKGEWRRTKFGMTQDAPTKKAVITLHKDDSIELF